MLARVPLPSAMCPSLSFSFFSRFTPTHGRFFALLVLLVLLVLPTSAHAQATAQATAQTQAHVGTDEVPGDFPRLVLETGRTPVLPPEPDLVRVQIHGEYQLRYQRMSSFTLAPSASIATLHPGATGDSIGQNDFLAHWLRVTPRLQMRENIEIVGQLDVVTGMVLGDRAHDTFADDTPRSDYNGFSNVQPRWLFAEVRTAIGLFRVGQQPSHWGMGIVANDGDHPTLFGDYRYGNINEEILFATRPGGKDSPFVVAAGGALVFRDDIAQLTRGDRAWQGVLAGYYESGPNRVGLYAVYRNQTRDRTSASDLFPYSDRIEAGVIDVAGNFAAPIRTPGVPAYVFGAFEGAAIFGSTNALRTNEQAASSSDTKLRSYGGAASAGIVLGAHRRHTRHPSESAHTTAAQRPDLFGKLVTQIEIGYASGDADPLDGTEKRFTFNSNHKVGLLLFDEVMRWSTARAASAAQDPLLSGPRPAPGLDLLPSNGGVFGAQYVNPTMLYRPLDCLDLKAGAVIAQTTADLVDPYRLVTQGKYINYRGGDATKHDLGIELDAGAEARFALDYRMTLQLGVQGGVLFPGGALADQHGDKMKTPWLVVGRAGLQF
jgi:hypothetical protein